MKKLSYILSVVLLVALTACVTYIATFQSISKQVREEILEKESVAASPFAKFLEVAGLYNELYLRENKLDLDKLNTYLIDCYMAATGDNYNAYYTTEEVEALSNQMNGRFSGIGVLVGSDYQAQAIYVLSVFSGSPAEKAGLMVGDQILAVRDSSSGEEWLVADIGIDAATARIKGEQGTPVDLLIKRTEEQQWFTLIRDNVVGSQILYKVSETDPSVGIIRIIEFDNTTPSDFEKAMDNLLAQGCTKFVFDVRNNPGGLLNSVEAVLDDILPEGPVVRIEDKQGETKVAYYSDAKAPYGAYPIVVLVNGDSASAAELFTSAIKDYAAKGDIKAKIVGEKTFGKGSMQQIVQLSDGSAVKATTNLYSPPYSENYDGVGIMPDVVVLPTEEAAKKNPLLLTESEDAQLQKAIQTLAEETGD